MEFLVLGPLEVWSGGRLLPLRDGRERALLGILLLHPNEPVSADRLVEELWSGRAPASAKKILQGYVSSLRRLLAVEPRERIATWAGGYELHVEPDELDLLRFEALLGTIRSEDDPARRAELSREALSLFRGDPLADFRHEGFAQIASERLEGMRLAALEERSEADLELGRHAALVVELSALTHDHPLRERLHAQLMLALYRSGRQADALTTYQALRRYLADEIGLEPSLPLKDLQRRILAQDPTLELKTGPRTARAPSEASAASTRSIFTVAEDGTTLTELVGLMEPLGRGCRPRELVLTWLVRADEGGTPISEALSALSEERASLAASGIASRVAAFSSRSFSADALKLASRPETDMLAFALGPDVLRAGEFPTAATHVLAEAPCDVVVWLKRGSHEEAAWREGPILVPFGGSDHDWAALELGALLGEAAGRPLRMLGTTLDAPDRGRPDASDLLATAGLVVQRAIGVVPDVRLVAPGYDGVIEAADAGGLLVIGLSDRWRAEGLGMGRWAISRRARPPALYVRRGARPSALGAGAGSTRHPWSTT